VRVGDVLKLRRSSVRIQSADTYEEIGVRSFGRGIFHKAPVSGADLGTKRVFEIRPGDLVLNNVFAWEGAIAVAGDAESGRIGSHRFMTYVPRDERVDVLWACHFFLSEAGLELIRRASPGSAGRNRTLNIDAFEGLEINLPPIAAQRRAAKEIASALDGVARIADLVNSDSQKTHVLLYPGIVDLLTDRRRVGSQALADLVEVISDLVRPGDDPAPADCFVGLQHIQSHTGRRVGSEALGDEKGRKYRFAPGDILYGYLRPYLNKVWVADRDGLCSVDQYVLRSRGESPHLIAHWLRSRKTLDQAVALTHNLQLPRLRSALLLGLGMPRVPTSLHEKLTREIETALETVTRLSDLRASQLAALRALPESIRNHAMQRLATSRRP
jgi:type I restriction enzyme S subunit